MRENKAITLISLIVTIVVLLILASVTLNAVLGEHGIITMAKAAKENMELAQVQEQAELNQLYEQLYKGGTGSSEGSGGSGDSGSTGNGNSGNTGDNGNNNGGSTGGNGGTGGSELTGQTIKGDNYGEYVDYGLDINKNGDTTDDWKIFYTNNDGRIFLIAADYVPKTCPAVIVATDKDHTNMVLDSGNYECYGWKSSSSAKYQYHCNDKHNTTLNQDKTQCSFPELFMPSGNFCLESNHYYCSDHVGSDGTSGNINAICASALQCTDNWNSFVTNSKKNEYADYAIGGPTLEMWVASWNKIHGATTETSVEGGITLFANGNSNSNSSGYYGYCVGTSKNCTTCKYDLSSFEGYNDPLYFPHQTCKNLELDNTGDSNEICYGYWIASPTNYIEDDLIQIIYDGNIYYGGDVRQNSGYTQYKVGLRPVVCLKEGVKLTKNTEKSNDTKTVYDLSMANS